MTDANSNQQLSTKGLGKEQGSSGTLIYSGIITNEEYNPKLTGKNALKLYDIMRRSDATVRAVLQVCKLPILSAQWDVKPASDEQSDIDIAAFVKRELMERNINFHNFLRESLTAFDFGFSIGEKTFELTDYNGQLRVGISKIGFRKQTSLWAWEMSNGKEGIQQQLLAKVVDIPRQKLIVFTHDKEGDNHEGISLLRAAYKPWDMKDKLERINVIAIEKMAIGVPVLKKPDDADAGELSRARLALRQFRGNEEGYQEIPTGWEIEMLDMKANSTKEVIPTIQYLTREISKSVLAQFLELGGQEGASGSRAVSQDHSKLFLLSEEAAAKNIQSTINEQLIKQLCDLNFSDLPNGYPQLVFTKIGDDDVTVMADAVQKFTAAGTLSADPDMEKHVRELLHLPAMSKEVSDAWAERFETAKETRKLMKEGEIDKDADRDLGKEAKNTDPKKNKENLKAQAIINAERARKGLIDILVME
jgi:phage gp29-like protein